MTDRPLDPREDVTGFLALMPEGLPPALPLIDEGRRALYLEDAGRTLARVGAALFTLYPLTTPAQVEAGRVFTFAGSAWAVFLEEISTPPAVMASRVRLWAHEHGTRAAAPLGTKEAGACAAWWAVATLAAWCAYEGFTDGQAEDLITSVLEGLEDPAPRTLN